MKKINLLSQILLIFLFFNQISFAAKSDYFGKGKELFDKKSFQESKVFFERDIVFNPKSEKSYLYLAKIFNKKENDDEEEMNLDTVLLLNPKNEEAIYMLILLKIKQSDYDEAKKLIENFTLVCKSFCSKKDEVQNKFNKLIPENEKDKN